MNTIALQKRIKATYAQNWEKLFPGQTPKFERKPKTKLVLSIAIPCLVLAIVLPIGIKYAVDSSIYTAENGYFWQGSSSEPELIGAKTSFVFPKNSQSLDDVSFTQFVGFAMMNGDTDVYIEGSSSGDGLKMKDVSSKAKLTVTLGDTTLYEKEYLDIWNDEELQTRDETIEGIICSGYRHYYKKENPRFSLTDLSFSSNNGHIISTFAIEGMESNPTCYATYRITYKIENNRISLSW